MGISDIISYYRIKVAVGWTSPYAHPTGDGVRNEGCWPSCRRPVEESRLVNVHVMVDCTPEGIAAGNLEGYKAAGIKAVVQGGEALSVTGHYFVAQANYSTALGRDVTRVVSCTPPASCARWGITGGESASKGARGADPPGDPPMGGEGRKLAIAKERRVVEGHALCLAVGLSSVVKRRD